MKADEMSRIEALVRAAVLRHLGRAGAAPPSTEPSLARPQADVLFTSGHGEDTRKAIEGIAGLARRGLVRHVYLSPTAARLLGGTAAVQTQVGAEVLAASFDLNTLELLRGMDLLILGSLSRNTASKVSLGIGDSFAANMMIQALTAGIPVVASRDACDPEGADCPCVGTTKMAPAMYEYFKGILSRLESWGVEFTWASDIASVALRRLEAPPEIAAEATGSRLVTASDVLAAQMGARQIVLAPGGVVTALALEEAGARGVAIIRK